MRILYPIGSGVVRTRSAEDWTSVRAAREVTWIC